MGNGIKIRQVRIYPLLISIAMMINCTTVSDFLFKTGFEKEIDIETIYIEGSGATPTFENYIVRADKQEGLCLSQAKAICDQYLPRTISDYDKAIQLSDTLDRKIQAYTKRGNFIYRLYKITITSNPTEAEVNVLAILKAQDLLRKYSDPQILTVPENDMKFVLMNLPSAAANEDPDSYMGGGRDRRDALRLLISICNDALAKFPEGNVAKKHYAALLVNAEAKLAEMYAKYYAYRNSPEGKRKTEAYFAASKKEQEDRDRQAAKEAEADAAFWNPQVYHCYTLGRTRYYHIHKDCGKK